MNTINIYVLLADANRYQNIVPVNERDWQFFSKSFDGKPQGKNWESPQIEVLIDKAHKNRPESDMPDFASHIPVFSRRAVNVLQPLIEPYGEFLKLAIDTQELYAFNVTKLVDALDLDKSVYETFSDGKRIMLIRKHVFKDSVIAGLPIFKLIQSPLAYVYVNEIFVAAVKNNNLTGFSLQPVR